MRGIIFLVVFITFVLSKKPEDPSVGVVDVTSSNSASVFSKDVDALVEFYAPWCGHCKNLVPEYAKLGELIEKNKPLNVVVAKVDCTKENEICSKYGVQGYPTIKFFPKGKTDPEDYQGGRSAEDFVKFLNEKAGTRLFIPKEPSFAVDLDESDFDSTVFVQGKSALVMFYAPWCGHCKTLKPTFELLGKAFSNEENVVIAKVDTTKATSLGTKYDIKGYPTLKWVTTDNKVEDANVGRSLDELVKYVNERAGTFRNGEGFLNDKAGLYDPLSALAKKYVESSVEERYKLVAQAEDLLKNLPSNLNAKSLGYYVRAMKKISAKGKEFVDKEKKRLHSLLMSKSVSQKMLDSFTVRFNVLSQF